MNRRILSGARLARFLTLVLLFVGSGTWRAIPAQTDPRIGSVIWSLDTGHMNPLEPLVSDFSLTSGLEILFADRSGKLALVDAATGARVWSEELKDGTIWAPLSGQFARNPGPPEIAVLTQNGELRVLAAASGKSLAFARIEKGKGYSVLLPPMMLLGSDLDLPDRMLVMGNDRRIGNYSVSSSELLLDDWEGLSGGALGSLPLRPPALVRLQAESSVFTALVYPDLNRDLMLLNIDDPRAPAQPGSVRVGQTENAHVLAPLDARGIASRILLVDPLGNVRFFQPRKQDSKWLLELSSEEPIRAGATPHPRTPPLLMDISGDGVEDIILFTASRMISIDGATRSVLGDHTIVKNFATPPAGFVSSDGQPVLIVGDDGDFLHVFDPLKRGGDAPLIPPVRIARIASAAPLVFDADGDGRADILVQRHGGADLLRTNWRIEPGSVVWPGDRGGKHRGGGRSTWLEGVEKRRRDVQKTIVSNALETARISLRNKEHADALQAASRVLSYSPKHADAREIYRRAYLGKYMAVIAIGGLLLLGGLVVGIILTVGWMKTRAFVRRARLLAQSGQTADLLEHFNRFFARGNGRFVAIETMADICAEKRIHPDKLTRVLEHGRRLRPDHSRVALVLGGLYLRQDKLDETAARVYEQAERATANSAPFETGLGRIQLNAGNLDEARRHLEKALQLGDKSPALYLALARVYSEKKVFGPRYLAIYERAAQTEFSQAWLLDALARSHVLAGMQQDKRAQEVLNRLFEIDPDSPVANQEIAAAHYRAGRVDEAMAAARNALKSEPDNPAALQVMAWCLWRLGDNSAEARAVVYRASASHPNDSELLKAAASFLLDLDACEDFPQEYAQARQGAIVPVDKGDGVPQSTPAQTAPALVLAALEMHPADAAFNEKAVRAAMRWRRDDIARVALEQLRDARQLVDEETLLLAAINVRENNHDPKNLNTLYRAFSLRTPTPGLAELIAEILIEQQSHDPQSQEVFTWLLGAEPVETDGNLSDSAIEGLKARSTSQTAPRDRVRYGLHLAKVFRDQQHYAAMAETLRKVNAELEKLNSDTRNSTDLELRRQIQNWRTDVQRLLAVAHSNLKDFDEAVSHYQIILKSRPDDPEALIGLGRTYARMERRTDEMREAIARAHSLAPDDMLLNFASGRIAANHENWSEAAQRFGATLRGGKDYVQAIQDFLNILIRRAKGAKSIPARWLRVQTLLFLRDYEAILEETERILALNPNEASRVQSVFERVLQTESSCVPALYGKARMLHRADRNTEARRLLEEIEGKAARPDPAARRLLMDVIEAVLAKEPENTTLRFKLGKLAMEHGEYDKAVNAFQKTRLDRAHEKPSIRCLAECFLHKKMPELALQEFQNVGVDAEALPLLHKLAQDFEQQGNLLAARMAYQRVYGFDAGYKDVADRLNHLSQASDPAATGLQATLNLAGGAESKAPKQRFDLRRELGKGAMATVYEAYDRELEEIVALKILPDNYLNNEEALRRFRQEARSARKLAHENIIRIHDIGEEMGRKFISMEYIEGDTLRHLIRSEQRQLTPEMTLRFARQIASAMGYAHANGIVHRDLKPANIMIAHDPDEGVEKGMVKIADFGIAKVAESGHQTITGAVVGTPLYMSPEQVLGRGCDHRADIYSFGVLLYEMLSGNPPFREGDLAYHHLHTPPPPLEGVSEPLAELVLKCLEKEADKRPANFEEILDALNIM